MEHNGKLINKILKDFLVNETEATDMRIMSIRHFLSALNNAVDQYIAESEDEKDIESRKMLVVMFDDMAEIYRNEVSDLLLKRGKLQHYLEMFGKKNTTTVKSSQQLREVKENLSDYIN